MAGVQALDEGLSHVAVIVSIPQSGWRGFKPLDRDHMPGCVKGFNPSVGMAGVQAPFCDHAETHRCCFNPSVGMAGVQAIIRRCRQIPVAVSIPQSGWRGFKPIGKQAGPLMPQFQSLSRDGGGSSRIAYGLACNFSTFQSLSRDGGGSSVKQGAYHHGRRKFQSLSRDGGGSSSVVLPPRRPARTFQSLSRDGGGSSKPGSYLPPGPPGVSIPQSGWRGFKLRSAWPLQN